MTEDAQGILEFWFGDATADAQRGLARNAVWFGSDPAFDREIEQRFGDLVQRARRGALDDWRDEPRSTLALVILLDQFPRNLFRGTAEAFASDSHALAVALEAIARGYDRQLHPIEAAFLYLPLEHAEALAHQDRCVALMEALGQRCAPDLVPLASGYADYARQHRDLIRRFGRFPYRNEALGRSSTSDERAYLDAGAETFGQSR